MAPKRKRARSKKTYCLIPYLHKNVTALLEAEDLYFGFHDKDKPTGRLRQYDTNVKGRFVCQNNACLRKEWYSLKIAITIRMYSGAEYNARVYKQRCERCNTLGHLVLDRREYADRVAYRIKKWCGVDVEPCTSGKSKDAPMHRHEQCEGCKAGHCRKSRMAEYDFNTIE